MREIKFRVHDEKTGKILAHEVFNTNINRGYFYLDAKELEENGGDSICHAGSEYFKHPKSLGIVRRVLYTGLKDKNGKEIYEGDVVKWSYSQDEASSFIAKVIWIDFVDKGDLDTDQRHIGFMLEFSDKGITDFPIKQELEIIGNVYENLELKEAI